MTIGIFSLWSCYSQDIQKVNPVKHVVIIGFDGLSPDGIENAVTPNFHRMMQEGASTLHARAVLPSSSSTNWASMIMGAGPEQHGITSNNWERTNFVLPAIVQEDDFLFPTIFHLIDQQIPNAEIGAIYHWDGFGRLFEKKAVDYDVNPASEDATAQVASAYIMDKKPTFTFIHFDPIDHAGHEFGHGSLEYYKAVEKGDALLGEVVAAIKKSGMAAETLVIITSDHGGIGKGHGGETLAEVEIPLILWGQAIRKNYTITDAVYQYDTAATVAYALGIRTPHAWIGRPIKNAFEGISEVDDYPVRERFKEAVFYPKALLNTRAGGLFDEIAEVRIENPNASGQVFYTVDGSQPSSDSYAYTGPFQIKNSRVLKSAVFSNGKINSLVSEAFYRIKPRKELAEVSYEVYYLDALSSNPKLANKTPNKSGFCFEIGTDGLKEDIKENTAVRFRCQIKIETAGKYTFYSRSDDGSILKVNGKEVVDNDGDHGVKEAGGSITLEAGIYPLEVVYFNGGGSGFLDVYYESRNLPKQIIPSTVLSAPKS